MWSSGTLILHSDFFPLTPCLMVEDIESTYIFLNAHPLDPYGLRRGTQWAVMLAIYRCSCLWRELILVLVTIRLKLYSSTFFIVHEAG